MPLSGEKDWENYALEVEKSKFKCKGKGFRLFSVARKFRALIGVTVEPYVGVAFT
jgi:hypothetical protein